MTEKKPIVLIKSGRTEAGAKAASSHTGSLSENDEVLDAIIRKSGIIRVDTLDDAFAVISALSKTKRPKGKRVAVITNAGGPGILVADSLFKNGFELPTLSDDFRMELKGKLLPEASTSNPIDLVAAAPPEHYNEALKACVASGEYDAIAIVCVPPAVVDTGKVAESLVDTIKSTDIPVLTSFLGPTMGLGARTVLNKNAIANFDFPEQIATVFNYITQTPKNSVKSLELVTPSDSSIIQSVKKMDGILAQDIGLKLIETYGFHVPASVYVTKNKLEQFDLEFPVVAKIDHPEIAHKSDVGGVKLNIDSLEALNMTLKDFYTRFDGLSGVIIQEQIQGDIELLLGATHEDNTGHSIFVGLGGIFVEILKDYAIGHVPINASHIYPMIESLKAYPLLKGYRGQEGIDTDQLAQMIQNLNQLLLDLPMIQEMDLNPLKYDPQRKKLFVVDTVIRI